MSKNGKAHLNELYRHPLPLAEVVVPLPPIHLNPLALVLYLYAYLFPSSSRSSFSWSSPLSFFFSASRASRRCKFHGTLHAESLNIWITDVQAASELWQSGFFGKGQYSRSEPSWYVRTLRSLHLIGEDERLTAEEVTGRRRVARAKMKADRARRERQLVEDTLRAEGKMSATVQEEENQRQQLQVRQQQQQPQMQESIVMEFGSVDCAEEEVKALEHGSRSEAQIEDREKTKQEREAEEKVDTMLEIAEEEGRDIPNLECLQLTLHEALFLSLVLGVLDIHRPRHDDDGELNHDIKDCVMRVPTSELLHHFVALSDASLTVPVPRSAPSSLLSPDVTRTRGLISTSASFLVGYAVYHHYRSLGWTVRAGIKFGVDWLLYKRGPVFSHAEFSVVVVPSPRRRHEHATQGTGGVGQEEVVVGGSQERPWWWIHTLSRVNGQVKKTLILTYVEYDEEEVLDLRVMSLKEVMGRYCIREVSLRRWVPSRNRD